MRKVCRSTFGSQASSPKVIITPPGGKGGGEGGGEGGGGEGGGGAGGGEGGGDDDPETLKRVRKRLEDGRKANAVLATSVLQMIGPYNWVACQNCGHRNNSGTRCLQCGHSIEFDVME